MRDEITTIHFPDKVTIDEFFELLFDQEEKEAFVRNMERLKVEVEQYPEEWAQTFLAWKELNR